MAVVYIWNKYNAELSTPISTLVSGKTVTNLDPLIGHTVSLVYIPNYGGSNGTNGYISISSSNMQILGSGIIGNISSIPFSNVLLTSDSSGSSAHHTMLAIIIDDDPNKCICYIYTLNDDLAHITGTVSITSSASVSISYSEAGSGTVRYRCLSITGWNYVQGSTSYGTVESSARDTYPDDGKLDDYWYTYVGTGLSSDASKFYIGSTSSLARFAKKMYLGDTSNLAAKIKKAYIGDSSNIARLFFSSGIEVSTMKISYTGSMVDQKDIVMDGITYRLLTLTSSGTLTLEGAVTTDIWMCGGGVSPSYYTSNRSSTYGGDGGYFIQSNGKVLPESVVCVVGAGGSGASSIDNISSADGTKGSGGGASGYSVDRWGEISAKTGSSGGGASTVPFLATSIFEPHCAGGGGGGDAYSSDKGDLGCDGGSGGTNGGTGGSSSIGRMKSGVGGAGGNKGGGKGGNMNGINIGEDATYYGSGGGGKPGLYNGEAGKGYQGVIYIRIPYEQVS